MLIQSETFDLYAKILMSQTPIKMENCFNKDHLIRLIDKHASIKISFNMVSLSEVHKNLHSRKKVPSNMSLPIGPLESFNKA